MAMVKVIQNEAGVNIDYWKISYISINSIASTAEIILVGYVCEQCRRDSKTYVTERHYKLFGDEMKNIFNNNVLAQEGMNEFVAAYEYIKHNDIDFYDAEDV